MKKIATIEEDLKNITNKVEIRKASRAVVIHNGMILMIRSNVNGDFKFPGGGRHPFEDPIKNLIRETKEETGYDLNSQSVKPIGYIEEIRKSNICKNGVFKMISEFYLCDIIGQKEEPNLDDYEKQLDYQALFVLPNYALEENNKLDFKKFAWLKRENIMLELVIRMIGDKSESPNML